MTYLSARNATKDEYATYKTLLDARERAITAGYVWGFGWVAGFQVIGLILDIAFPDPNYMLPISIAVAIVLVFVIGVAIVVRNAIKTQRALNAHVTTVEAAVMKRDEADAARYASVHR